MMTDNIAITVGLVNGFMSHNRTDGKKMFHMNSLILSTVFAISSGKVTPAQ